MLAFKIIWILVGIVFVSFGHAIYFKKKYNLINNFKEDMKSKRYNNAYAKRVGLIELIGGLTCVVLGLWTIFFDVKSIIIVFAVSIIGIIVALIINMVKSSNKVR